MFQPICGVRANPFPTAVTEVARKARTCNAAIMFNQAKARQKRLELKLNEKKMREGRCSETAA